MTAYETLAIDFPSAPITGDTLATVQLVSRDWRAIEDWARFEEACRDCAEHERDHLGHAHVYPDHVRLLLTNPDGELSINPRRLSAFYNRAAGKAGFLDFSHWSISEDTKGRNQGKPCRVYVIRASP